MKPLERGLGTCLRWLGCLALAKFLLLALALPAFEGTDEPFHLDRARAFAEAPSTAGWGGRALAPGVVAAVRVSPCGADLRRAFDCPAWGGGSAWFNVLEEARPPSGGGPVAPVANYQDHQPPLYYAAAGAVLRLVAPGASPRRQLLVLRLLAVALVAGGVALCFRFLGDHLRLALVAVLLLPGAAEALVRPGNDTAVFLWAAALLAVVARREDGTAEAAAASAHSQAGHVASTHATPGDASASDASATRAAAKVASTPHAPAAPSPLRLAGLFLLAAAGPLIKLTAIPIVAFAALQRSWHRRWWEGAAAALGGLAVFPLQLTRGWALGGTLELNALEAGAAAGAASPTIAAAAWWEPLLGVAHSAYTFAKTAVWLGGWSVFRPPGWVVIAAVALALTWIALARLRRPPRDWPAHVGAALLAAVGFVAFAVGKQRVFGFWGAVGGWYLWGWLPWLLLAGRDLVTLRPDRLGRVWALAALAFLVAVNAAWWVSAHRLYGG